VHLATLTPAVPPHWLQRLGLVAAPEGTTLREAELSLQGGFPWWLAAFAVALAGAAALYLYRRESARLGVLRSTVLALLRTALVALVLVLLLRPVLLAEFAGSRPRPVVLLIDTSQSMSAVDRRVSDRDKERLALARGVAATTALPDASRIDVVKDVLRNDRLDLLARLGKIGPLQRFAFDRRLTSLEGDDLAGSLKAEGARTALADALHDALARLGAELPAAIVVVSDGRDNASARTLEEAARACRDKGVPLHVWGVGSSEGGILRIKDVRVPQAVFVDATPEVEDDAVEVPVRFRCRGFKKGTLLLTVKLGDQIVRERFPVSEGENLSRTVKVKPKKGPEGDRALEVRLQLDGSADVADEVRKRVPVRSSRVKVLYAENAPRRDYRFLQPVLDRDRRVLARFYLAEADPNLAEAPADRESGAMFLPRFPENFPDPDPRDPDRRPYDLLILGDVPYKALGDRQARAVGQFVKEGGGLVVLAGRAHTAELAGSPLAEVLPVEIARHEFPAEEVARLLPFRPALTYDGEHNPMLALADLPEESLKIWKDDLWRHAAGFWWHYPVADLRPGASALLVHPAKKAGRSPDLKPMPVFAAHHYGKGEVLFLGTDETWRWRDNTGDRLTARFWGQVVARMGLPHLLGARRTQLDLERDAATLGQPGSVKARLLDPKYEPITRPAVKATLVSLDARDEDRRSREITLRRVAGQPGEYRGALPNDTPGRHELRLPAGDGLEGGALAFGVELPPRHELEEAGLAEDALRALAATSGGAFYREEDLERLPDAITPRASQFALRREVLLWNPLALVLFVVLITAEWVLRKFSNLS
jgi:hypothetical protein